MEARVSERNAMDETRRARLAERMRWRATSDAELVIAMRAGSYEALREFYARFEPLLARYAARAGVSMDSWEDDAHDVLCDVVLALIADEKRTRGKTREATRANDAWLNATPNNDGSRSDAAQTTVRDIHSYIQRAFHNRMLDARRATARRDRRDTHATAIDADSGERIVLAACSEGSLRASSGADRDAAPLSPAIARLSTVLGAELSGDERKMLTWVGNGVPMREIAIWLEISYAAAKVRLSRTRSRLRARALRHVNECAGAERTELLDFFRRAAGEQRNTPHTSASDRTADRQSRTAEPGGAHGDD
jgi:DNA-directed RNA polymerase specialized sigma24 family protein